MGTLLVVYCLIAMLSMMLFAYKFVEKPGHCQAFPNEVNILLGMMAGTIWPVSLVVFVLYVACAMVASKLVGVKFKE